MKTCRIQMSELSEVDGEFFLTITTTVGKSRWTSGPVPLVATDFGSAVTEAKARVNVLRLAQGL